VVVAILAALWRSRRAREADPGTVFMVVAIGAYLGPFAVTDYFDRYLLYILPFVFALWTRLSPLRDNRDRRAAALGWIAFSFLVSAAATHDYFEWNRARWAAIHAAEKLGGGPDSIDGGFEYGGLARFNHRAASVPEGKSWYWVNDDRFVVAFSEVKGYKIVGEWHPRTWLPRSPGRVILLRREP
jgi:hypothetical protein